MRELAWAQRAMRTIFVASDGGPSIGLVGVVSFASAMLILTFAPDVTELTVLWPANALVLAAAAAGGPRRAPARVGVGALGGFAANFITGAGLFASMGYTIANALEIGIALALLQILGLRDRPFGRVGTILCFVMIAGIVAPAVGATIGASVASVAADADYKIIWMAWFASCALGALVVVPVALICWQGRHHILPRTLTARVNALCSGVAVAIVSLMAFSSGDYPLLFVPFAALVVSTARSGWFGAAGALAIVSMIAIGFTMAGLGPVMLIDGSNEQALFLQFYLATCFVTTLTVAALLDERRQLTRSLRSAEARYRLLSETSADALLHVSPAGVCLYASPASLELIGLNPAEIEGRHLLDFVHKDDHRIVSKVHLGALASPDVTEVCRYRVAHRTRGARWLETRTRGIRDEDGRTTGIVSVNRDVTEDVAREADLVDAARTDPLTGLANRRRLTEMLASLSSLEGEGHFAVAMLDIDHFKRINDRYGHAAGDEVLREVARVCRETVRGGDLAARTGGEEFALLFPGTDEAIAGAVVDRVRAVVENLQICVSSGAVVTVTLSAGIAIGRSGADASDLLATADAELYAAKAAGRNRVRLRSVGG